MYNFLKSIFLILFIFSTSFLSASTGNSPQKLFTKASKIESQKKYSAAIKKYNLIEQKFSGNRYAGEAIFRIAVIYDEKLFLPKEASDFYKKYISRYNGRNSKRAEIRLKILRKYSNCDPKIYQEYKSILSKYPRGHKKKTIALLKKFISDYPKITFLDEPLLWLANEYRGFKRTNSNIENIDKAIILYKKIINNYPKKTTTIAAYKNLGDCYRIKGNNIEADKYYRLALDKGGDYGRRLVGKYHFMAKQGIYHNILITTATILTILSILALIIFIPLKKINLAGIKKGLKHSLLFLPGAIILTVVTFLLTDASKDNITGREPYLILVIMIITLIAIIFNGMILEVEEREPVNMKIYASALITLIISLNFISFYLLKLLFIVERLFI